MIRLAKRDKPGVLLENETQWTADYLALLAGTHTVKAAATRYQHPDIKSELRTETRAKCAYCESRIKHVAPEHIEHILPKKHRPELIVQWENLTLACPECNLEKRDYYSEAEPLLNPYEQEPYEHLSFHGPLVLAAPGSDVGIRSVTNLGLGRPALFEARRDRLLAIRPLVDSWARAGGVETKAALASEIRTLANDDAEFSATIRAYLVQVGFPLED